MGKLLKILLVLLAIYLAGPLAETLWVEGVLVVSAYFGTLPFGYQFVIVLTTILLVSFFVGLLLLLKAKKRPIVLLTKKYNKWAGIRVAAFAILYPLIHSFVSLFVCCCFVKDLTELIHLGLYIVLAFCILPVFVALTWSTGRYESEKDFEKAEAAYTRCQTTLTKALQTKATDSITGTNAAALKQMKEASNAVENTKPEDCPQYQHLSGSLAFLKYEYESFQHICSQKEEHKALLKAKAEKKAEKQVFWGKLWSFPIIQNAMATFTQEAKKGNSSATYIYPLETRSRTEGNARKRNQYKLLLCEKYVLPELKNKGFKNATATLKTTSKIVRSTGGHYFSWNKPIGTISGSDGSTVTLYEKTREYAPVENTYRYETAIHISATW